MRTQRGFTLIEMLVVAILMVVIVAAVAVIFAIASRTVADTEAQHNVTNSARYALERIAQDFFGCKGWDKQGQRMILQNGGANHVSQAQDSITVRSNTVAGSSTGDFEVTYALVALADQYGAQIGAGKTALTNRQIYKLVRRVRVKSPAEPNTAPWTGIPASMANFLPPGEEEVATNVISFNVEFLNNQMNYSQLEPSPCPLGDPLGDDLGANDTTAPRRIPFVRVTLILLSDYQERSERLFSRAIAIPVG